MNTLRGQYSFIAQFLGGQPVEPEKTYRQLSFCRTVDVDGETVVFNVLTGEIAALTGNVTAKDGAPYLHFHIAVCGEDGVVYGGHLNEAVISATAELYFTLYEILPERVREEETGLNLLSFPKQRRF